eukprot:TRINITY_DN57830_c0_g1_i1.p1 TRINITY_DN57830_c0_g1~~TRINITY_DN57830_c0_g1_i1.p1  ORF type:complete len:120 (+),score=20.87 TRINITY_DN57830_c0_g1_i1:160-519(+)
MCIRDRRVIHEHHTGALDTFVWSNAPQAVLKDGDNHTFIYNVAYLSGRPNFEVMAESYTDHAWVTRNAVSYTHLRAHETPEHIVCRLLLEKKKPCGSGAFRRPAKGKCELSWRHRKGEC